MSKEVSRGKHKGNFKSTQTLKKLFKKGTERCKTTYIAL
jgi:hypothetical protein